MADAATEYVNRRRERDQRVALANQVQHGPAWSAARANTNPGTTPANGYGNGDTWVNYFVLGVSILGGPDKLK